MILFETNYLDILDHPIFLPMFVTYLGESWRDVHSAPPIMMNERGEKRVILFQSNQTTSTSKVLVPVGTGAVLGLIKKERESELEQSTRSQRVVK